jgi:phage terminase small subunit
MLVIDEYMKDCNQRQAMLRAGYSVSAADSRRSRHTIFGNPAVQQEIARRQNVTAEKHEITKDMIVQEVAKLAFGSIGSFIKINEHGKPEVDFTNATEDALAALEGITIDEYVEGRGEDAQRVRKVKVTTAGKRSALELLAKLTGNYEDSLTLKGELTLVERLQAGRNRIKQPVIEAQVADAD